MSSIAKNVVIALVAALLGAGAYKTYSARQHAGHEAAPAAPTAAAQPERPVLYWHDPMYPQQRFDKPGKSPFMDMDLVPVYADDARGGTVSIDPRVAQNLGLRLATVDKGVLGGAIEAPGIVQADETRIQVVQTRVLGYIERQNVRALNQLVARGEALFELTAPELVAAQEELILAVKADDAALAAAARMRLSLMGLSDPQIERVQTSGRIQRRIAVPAPVAGYVTELAARPGMTVMPGAPLLTLTDLSRVWVIADVAEAQAATVAPGRGAEIRFAALPGETYNGKVDFLYPEISGNSRTLRVRIPLTNPNSTLKPGMLAQVSFGAGSQTARLLAPAEAVIETGKRSVVIVAEGAGAFRVAEVETGRERDGKIEILSGLEGAEQVVASGQFLIDSEASLKTSLTRLEAAPPVAEHAHADMGSKPDAPAALAQAAAPADLAQGRIDAVDMANGKVKLSHGPIKSLGMPGMTMNFRVAEPALLEGLKPGQQVEFQVIERDGDYFVTHIKPKR